MLCQMCSEHAYDAVHAVEVDHEGNYWVYCRPCDAWTSHPPEPEEPTVSDVVPRPQPPQPNITRWFRLVGRDLGRLLADAAERKAAVDALVAETELNRGDIEFVLDAFVKLAKPPVGPAVNVPPPAPGDRCHSAKDGDCTWGGCPQLRDNEPAQTGRHCPLDTGDDDYQ